MKRIHIARNRQPLGHFAPEEVATGLRSGRFMPSDLAWCDPMESWKPLSEFTDLPVAESPALEPPVLPLRLEETDEPVVTPPVIVEPAWERRQELGLVAALLATVKAFLGAPTAAFKSLKTEGNIGQPVLFYVILGTVTGWVSLLYQYGITLVNPEMTMGAAAKELTTTQITVTYVFIFFVLPVIMVAAPFVTAAIFHGILTLMGGATRGYEATLRVFCYGWGAALVFQLIPGCGQYIAMGWGMVLLAMGLKEVHRTDYMRSIVAVAAPLVLCCGLGVLIGTGMGAFAAGFK